MILAEIFFRSCRIYISAHRAVIACRYKEDGVFPVLIVFRIADPFFIDPEIGRLFSSLIIDFIREIIPIEMIFVRRSVFRCVQVVVVISLG